MLKVGLRIWRLGSESLSRVSGRRVCCSVLGISRKSGNVLQGLYRTIFTCSLLGTSLLPTENQSGGVCGLRGTQPFFAEVRPTTILKLSTSRFKHPGLGIEG